LSDRLEQIPGASEKQASSLPAWLSRSPFIAALLSILAAGLGQAYNRQWKKAIGFAIAALLSAWLFMHFRLLASFRGFILGSIPLLGFHIYISVDAALRARKRTTSEGAAKPTRVLVTVAVLVAIACAVLETSNFLNPLAVFRAFRIPTGSMCPTICVGDRIVADIRAFRGNRPQRGDVVMVLYDKSPGLFVKRVVGIEGDEMSDLGGRLEVNKSPVELVTSACGTPATRRTSDYQPPPDVPLFRVPEHHIFVVGDNLDNSFDSRYFGALDESRLRGRPLYLYWSATPNRIGCAIK
jgi:signal peptidase I